MSDSPPPPPPPQQPFSPQPANQPPPPPAPPPSPFSPQPANQPPPGPPQSPFTVSSAPPPNFGVTTAPRRSGRAVAALVLGISGVVLCFIVVPSILAIVFGTLALKEIKRSAGVVGGRGMAIAGLVLGIVGVVAGVIFWIVVAFGVANSTSVFDLDVGDCVELPDTDAGEVSRLKTFDCDEAHGAEVFATGDLGGGDDPYPGRDEVQAMIEAECRPAFEDYVGVGFDESELSATTIYPQESDWNDTQEYVCLVFDPDGDLTESVKDSGR